MNLQPGTVCIFHLVLVPYLKLSACGHCWDGSMYVAVLCARMHCQQNHFKQMLCTDFITITPPINVNLSSFMTLRIRNGRLKCCLMACPPSLHIHYLLLSLSKTVVVLSILQLAIVEFPASSQQYNCLTNL